MPFSFRYGGAASAELLKAWTRTESTSDAADHVARVHTWTDPKTGLKVQSVMRVFKRYPAVDWVLYFQNDGEKDTPILEDIQTLDLTLRTDDAKQPAVLHQIVGDQCNEQSYLPIETPLAAGKSIAMTPAGGRSSNGTFPFFNFQYGDEGDHHGRRLVGPVVGLAGPRGDRSDAADGRHGEDAFSSCTPASKFAVRASWSCPGRATARRPTTGSAG